MEIAVELGYAAILMLWDFAAFFDSIELPTALEKGAKAGVPMTVLTLAAQMHTAPRLLAIGQTTAPPVEKMGRSIVAGCTSCTSIARALLLDAVTPDEHTMPPTAVGQHVDDVCQMFVHRTPSEAITAAIAEGTRFAQQALDIGCEISDKSTVISQPKWIARAVARHFTDELGIQLSAADDAEDLGVQTTAGRRRITKGMANRQQKASKRAGRVGIMANKNKQKFSSNSI